MTWFIQYVLLMLYFSNGMNIKWGDRRSISALDVLSLVGYLSRCHRNGLSTHNIHIIYPSSPLRNWLPNRIVSQPVRNKAVIWITETTASPSLITTNSAAIIPSPKVSKSWRHTQPTGSTADGVGNALVLVAEIMVDALEAEESLSHWSNYKICGIKQ